MNLDPHQRGLLASLLAGASAASLAFTGYHLLSRRGGNRSHPHNEPPPVAFPISTAEVARWVSATAASPDTTRIFLRHGIDGEALASLGAQHLVAMGVPAQDRSRILTALAGFEDVPTPFTHAPPVVPTYAVRDHSHRSRLSPPPPRASVAHEARVVPLHSFLANAEDVFTDLINPGSARLGCDDTYGSEAELEPQQQRAIMASRLYDLLDVFHGLSAREQEDAMLPLARRLNVALTRPTPQTSVARSSVPPSVTAPPAPRRAAQREVVEYPHRTFDTVGATELGNTQPAAAVAPPTVAPLYEMLDGFLELLQSHDLDGVSAAELQPLAARIFPQVDRIQEVAKRLPSPAAESLTAKCRMVVEAFMKRMNTARAQGPMAPPTSARTSLAEKTAAAPSVAQLIAKLRDVFARTRDSSLLEMEADKRLKAVSGMMEEVKAIRAALASLPPTEQARTGMDVSENVLSLLEQLQALTQDEARLTEAAATEREQDQLQQQEDGAQAAAQARTLSDEEEAEDDTLGAEFSAVAGAFLERIVEALQSPTYVGAPSEIKLEILKNLSERVDVLAAEAAKLPGRQRTAAVQVTERAQRLLAQARSAVAREGKETSNGETSVDDEDAEVSGEGEEPEGAGTPSVVLPAMSLDDAVTQLERTFALLSNDAVVNAPAAKKRILGQELLKRTRTLKTTILALVGGATDHPLITELVEPLEELLEKMAGTNGPSDQLAEIMELLRDMEEVLSSDAFTNAPAARKVAIARATIQQLQRVTSTFPSLDSTEREIAEKLVAPINERLVAVVRGSSDEAVESPEEILKELHSVTEGLKGPAFGACSQSDRTVILQQSVAKLKELERRCTKLPPAMQAPITSMVANVLARLEALQTAMDPVQHEGPAVPSTVPANAPEAAPLKKQAPATNEKRALMFASLREITDELKEGNARGIKLTQMEAMKLKSLLGVMSDVDDITDEEESICDKFAAELQKATTPSEASAAASAEGKNHTVEVLDSSAGDDDSAAEGDDEDLEAFLQVFTSIQKTLKTKKLSSLSMLMPIMTVVEGTLSTADERGIPWQTNPEAVAVVSDVLSKIRTAQEELREHGSETSASVQALQEATRRIAANPPETRAELTPYLELLKRYMSAPTFTPAEMSAMEALKDAIMAAGQGLADAQHKAEAEKPTRETRIADALLEVSGKLRESELSSEDVDQYEAMVNQLANAAVGHKDLEESIAAVREQIRLQRCAQGSADIASNDGDEQPATTNRAQEAEPMSPGVFDEDDDADNSSVPVDAPEDELDLQGLSKDGVVGGPENEVELLSKIEERIGMPTDAFTAACSLFDIQIISKVLLHLSTGNERVKKDPALKKRVEEAKASFITQLAAFRAAENASADAQSSSKLKVTCKDTPCDGDDKATHELIVFASEEADQYPVDESLMNQLQEPTNVVSPSIGAGVEAGWTGASTALIVYAFDGAPADEKEHSTALAELVLLHEVLSKRYGFKVTTITDPRLTAESFMKVLRRTMSESQGRLLVYFCTPPSRSAVAVPQAMTFHDDSVLEYSRIVAETQPAVERLVVVHSLPRRLEMVCRLKEKESPTMSVRLTSKAANEVAKVRCWLYDGIFTPVVVELLCRDEGRMLCPEDLIHYAITTTTRTTIQFGSFTDSEAACMAYFLPTDK